MQKGQRNKSELGRLLDSVGLNKKQLVCPLFVKDHAKEGCKIASMPDVSVVSLEETTTQILELINLGISSIIVFGVPSERDSVGSNASDQNGIVQHVEYVKDVADHPDYDALISKVRELTGKN